VTGEIALVFGDPDGDHAAYGLHSRAEPCWVHSELRLVAAGRREVRDDRSGIEELALAHLRADLRELLAAPASGAHFADHDDSLGVDLRRAGDRVEIVADMPSADLFQVPLPAMTLDAVLAVAKAVDAAERRWGPLVGHCGCDRPSRWFFETRPEVS
jgi:hypothetical protein